MFICEHQEVLVEVEQEMDDTGGVLLLSMNYGDDRRFNLDYGIPKIQTYISGIEITPREEGGCSVLQVLYTDYENWTFVDHLKNKTNVSVRNSIKNIRALLNKQ